MFSELDIVEFFSHYKIMKQSDLYEKAGLNLKTRRQALKLRQADVAKLVGISRPSLANIESGKQAITLHLFYRISSVLEVTDARELLPQGVIQPMQENQPVRVKIKSTSKTKLNKGQIALIKRALSVSGSRK